MDQDAECSLGDPADTKELSCPVADHMSGCSTDKLASLLAALGRQLRQSPVAETVPIEIRPDPIRFYSNYYFANRPVVLRGLMDDWPALGRWSPEYFAERFADQSVEVSADRETDPYYEDNFAGHCRHMTMGELVSFITKKGGNDVYLVAKNRLLERDAFAPLRDDFRYPGGILTNGLEVELPNIWLGGAGTITPLHHDASNILFGQVFGRKLFRLIPPYEISNLYNDRTCFSAVDLENVDFARFPLFSLVTVLEVTVHPGDFLLIPLGWWHQVRSLDASISMSFQNFAVLGRPIIWDYSTR